MVVLETTRRFLHPLNALDSVEGGTAGTDVLTFTDSSTTVVDELTLVTGIETITLGSAATAFNVFDSNVAANATLTINAAALTATGKTLTLDASNEADGNLAITGGTQADTITGGSGSDTITGDQGVDIITLNGDTNDVVIAAADEFGDEITGFTQGASKDELDLSNAAIKPTSTGYVENVATTAIDTASTGLQVVSNNYSDASASMTITEVAAAFGGQSGVTGANNSIGYVAVTTNVAAAADVFVYQFITDGSNNIDEVNLVATLKGITSTLAFDTSNFDLA